MPAVLVPGRRVPGGSVARIGPGIVELEVYGNETIKKDISRGFRPALESLLKRAAFAGSFSVLVRTKIRGSQHTRGLRIGSPETQGVSITWHEGDNGNRIEMLLHRPGDGDVDSFGFHNRLIRASKDERDNASEDGLSSPAPESPPVGEQQAVVAQTNENKVEERVPYERFVDNMDNVQLFMLEIVGLALPDGRVMRRGCGAILDKTFGLRTRGNGAIVRSLIHGGFLIDVDRDWLRIPDEWVKRLRPAPAALPAQPSGDFLQQLQQLAAIAGTMEKHQTRLEELNVVISRHDEQIDALNQKRVELTKERDHIIAQMQSPEFMSAAKAFAVIRRLSGS